MPRTCLVLLLAVSTACRPHVIESVPLDVGRAREFQAEFRAVRDASAEAVLEENLSIERTLLPDDTTAMLVAKLSGTGLNPGSMVPGCDHQVRSTADRGPDL